MNLISTQVAQETLKGMKEAQKSMKRVWIMRPAAVLWGSCLRIVYMRRGQVLQHGRQP